MTHPLSPASLPEPGAQPSARLEREPSIAEEARRHQLLSEALSAQRQLADQARAAYRAALARRWSCEVAAQRAYKAAQRALAAHGGAAPSEPFAPASAGADSTPRGLLAETRRTAGLLEQIAPSPAFAVEGLVRLRIAGDELEAAIIETDACEAERRRLASEERVVARLLELAERRSLPTTNG